MKTNSKVDFYFNKNSGWQNELENLRQIILETSHMDAELTEDLKWGCPCYTHNGNNIVLLHVFKEYCAILFFKGALIKDSKGILVQQTENVQAARQLRFTNVKEILKLEKTIKAYVKEAIAIEKAGLKVTLKKTTEYKIPLEFEQHISTNKALKTAFNNLTPGRQRAYLLHFSGAKQAKTREERVLKCIPDILKGKGIND